MFDDHIFNLMIEHFRMTSEHLQDCSDLCDTMHELESLKTSTEAFGFDKSLIALLSAHGVNEVIPAIPSLETYLKDANVDVTVANEAVVDAIKGAVHRFVDAFMMHLTQYQKFYKNAIGLILSIGVILFAPQLIASLEALAAGSTLAASITIPKSLLYTAGGLTGVLGILTMVHSTPLAIKESLDLKLPVDVDARTRYVNKVRDIFKQRAGINIDNINPASMNAHDKGKTAKELGITKENVEALVSKMKEAVDEMRRCNFINERLKSLAESVEATTSNGRVALVFITSVITKTMHMALADTIKSVHMVKQLSAVGEHILHEDDEDRDDPEK